MLKYIMVILLSIIYYSIILVISFRVLQTGQVFKVLKINFFLFTKIFKWCGTFNKRKCM